MLLRDEIQKKGKWSGEFRNRKKDGTIFFTLAHISTIVQGGETQWISVQEDITDKKRAEALARKQLEHLQLFIEKAPVAIAMFDRQMRYLAASQRFLPGPPQLDPVHPAVLADVAVRPLAVYEEVAG